MKKLIFIYNANTGMFNAITDSAHKLFSPKTYSCNLCKLTYGLRSMKEEWADFIKSLEAELEFLHRDEFHKQFPHRKDEKLPAIFKKQDNKIELIIPADKIEKAKSIQDLIKLVKKML